MIHYSKCPVCLSGDIQTVLSAKDHTVSHKFFQIWQCDECSARFTQEVPDQESIGAYYVSENYISHSDTKKGLVNKLYHLVRKKTLVSKRNLVQHETGKQNGSILDIGCGTGTFLNCMQESGWKTKGLEPDDSARLKATSVFKLDVMPSGELFNLAPGSFQAITMWHVLEHVHQLHDYISQLKMLMTDKGRLFIAVPNYTSYDAAHYRENWAAYDVPRHLYHFSPSSMKKLMKSHGMNVKQVKPMWFDSFYVSMLSEKYKHGRGNIFLACWNGFVSNARALFNAEKCSSLIYIISKA